MEELRLPRNPREGIVFGTVVTAISCAIIGGANMYWAVGPDGFTRAFLTSYLLVFLFAFLVSSLLVERIAGKVVRRFYVPGDSTNSMICYNLIVFVLMMSSIMSVLGPLAGQIAGCIFDGGSLDVLHILENWQYIWPRNFCVAFFTELLIAQPVGRMVMVRMHTGVPDTV